MDFIKMTETGTTEVNIRYLNRLLLESYKLELLKEGGVDNWEWYGESLCGDESDRVIVKTDHGEEAFDKIDYAEYLMEQANIFKEEI